MSEEEGRFRQRISQRPHGSAGVVFRHLKVLGFALKDPRMSVVFFDRPFSCCSDTMVAQGVAVQAETEKPH